MPRQWFQDTDEITSATLTVRAQTVSPTDRGRLYWAGFLPRRDVDSVTLSDVTTLDDRPVADRREWNQRGRHVPPRTPARREVNIVPIEAYDKIEEFEMQKLSERFNGNQALMAEVMGVSIPARVERLALADYRRLEVDAFTAWLTGQIVQRNPQNAVETQTASFGFDSGRLQTAGTAWNDSGVNAYDEFIAWLEDAIDAVGNLAGAAMRLPTLQAIQADAPDLLGGVAMSRAQLATRISDDLGSPFQFFLIEDTVDVYTDGGIVTASTKVFTTQRVAAIPADGRIGYTAFAPVTRAMELARQFDNAGIDTRGVTVYYDEAATGRELTIEAQLNAVPVPDEQRVFVINAGV